MRPLSAAHARLLASPAGYTVRTRVRIQGPGGTWYNLSNLLDRDFLEEVTVDESLDAPAAQATVRLQRVVDGLTLAPYRTDSRANNLGGSYSPLVQPGRTFRVEVGLAPSTMEPTASDWLPLFLGRIDDVDSGPATMTFRGRDLVGVLQDVWLEMERVYGSDSGVPLQTVCQSILNDAGLGGFGLYTPTNPAWAVGKYKQDVSPVVDALEKLATARGWEVRQKLRPDTGDWGFWLWGPDRAATSPSWTYDASHYRDIGELATSLADIRTAVEVIFSDAADLDASGQPKRKTVRRENTAARDRYGYAPPGGGTPLHRFMRIAEATASNIRSAVEATRLADSALSDLSDGDAFLVVEADFHPALELGDLVQFSPNGHHFNAAQTLAVRQVTHTLSASTRKTRLAVKGKPSLSPRAWLSMEARPGLAPAAAFTGPAAPSGLTVTNSVTGAVLLFTAPNPSTGPEADSYELHVGTAPGFPLSSSTLKAVSSSTRFDLTGLTAGVAYYGRVRSRDRKGNVGPASAEVVLAPRYVEPRLLQPRVSFASSLLKNSDFEATNGLGEPPDAWAMDGGTWGVDAALSSDAYTGSHSMQFLTNSTYGPLVSEPISVRPGRRYAIDVAAKRSSSLVAVLVTIEWLDAGLTVVDSTVSLGAGTLTQVNDWGSVRGVDTAPANARYCRVRLGKTNGGTAWVDSVILAHGDSVQEAPIDLGVTNFVNGWGAYMANGRKGAAYWKDSSERAHLEGHIFGGAAGQYAFVLPLPYRPLAVRDFVVATNTGSTTVTVYATGEVTPSTSGHAWICLSGISYRTA